MPLRGVAPSRWSCLIDLSRDCGVQLPHACRAFSPATGANSSSSRRVIAQQGVFCQGGGEGVGSRPQPSRRPQTRRAPVKQNQTLPHACPASAGRQAQTPAAQGALSHSRACFVKAAARAWAHALNRADVRRQGALLQSENAPIFLLFTSRGADDRDNGRCGRYGR